MTHNPTDSRRWFGEIQHRRQVESFRFGIIRRRKRAQQVRAANHLVHRAESKTRHQLTHFFRDEKEIIHDMLGLTRKFFSQLWILRCDSHRTGVEMTLPHHHASFDDEWRSREPEFIGAKHRRDDHITPSLELTVRLQTNSPAQTIDHECLLRFGEPELPRNASAHDRRERRCTCTA